MEEHFYMCWAEGKSSPTVCHETLSDAEHEATRLARLEHNKTRRVYVLETVEFCKVQQPTPPVEWTVFKDA